MQKTLKIESLKTRRQFLKAAARKAAVPVAAAYAIAKTTPKIFAREPY
jgi:hypothetical protein